MNISFKDKTIVVTGATRGIGKQIADDLSLSGANLILTGTDRDQIKSLNELAESTKQKKRYFLLNLTDQESLNEFICHLNIISRIDGLVNNAGINRLNSIADIKNDDWNDMLSVNLSGPFQLMKVISDNMRQNQYGRIVNVASIFSVISKERRSAYSATKFGLYGLTVGVSNDLAKYNILVNTLSPGFVDTDLTRKNLSIDEIQKMEMMIPAGRLANVSDISNVAQFLLSDSNTYITGQNIIVDGGFTNV